MASNITVSGLVATPGVGHVALQWSYTEPVPNGHRYRQLDVVEVHAASSNDRSGASKIAEGRNSAFHMALTEGTTRYYWIKARDKEGSFGDWYPSGSTAGIVGTAGFAAGRALVNGKIVQSVNANALTVAVKTLSGDDPSSANPVYIPFRNAAASTGDYVMRAITGTLSITAPAGSTFGTENDRPFRLRCLAIDDGGTVRLGLVNCYDIDDKTIRLLNEDKFISAASGSGGTSPQAVYANANVTNKAFRRIGYLTWNNGLSTAGDFSSTADVVELESGSTPAPGDVVAEWVEYQSAYNSGSTTIPLDDTEPLNAEGNELMSVETDTRSPADVLEHEALINCSYSVASPLIGYIAPAAGDAIIAAWSECRAADTPCQIKIGGRHLNDLGATEYECCAGGSNAGTFSFNGFGGNRKFGGTMGSYYKVRELAT